MNMNESLEESEIVRERREGKSGDKGPQGECFHAISTSPKLPRVFTPLGPTPTCLLIKFTEAAVKL